MNETSKFWIALPVRDVGKSVEFFKKLGLDAKNLPDRPGFGMVTVGGIDVMLTATRTFQTFTPKPVCDAFKDTEVVMSVSISSRERVDEIVRLALAQGAQSGGKPTDRGGVYASGFSDLDGHVWAFVNFGEVPVP